MATLIGVVSQVVGEVFAVAGDGTRRPLVEGDRVYAGEQLVTGAGGAVAVTLSNGEVLTLGRDSNLSLNEQLLAGSDGQPAQDQAQDQQTAPTDGDLTDVEQLQAAIEAGVDPTVEGEATAAGPGAGGAGGAGGTGGLGGGHSFVLLSEVGGALDPVIGFPTEGLNTGPEFPDPEPIVTDDPAPDFTPTIDVEYEDASGAIVTGPAVVDEEGLSDGTNPGSNAEQASGSLIISSPDGVSAIQIQDVNGNWIDVTNGGVVQGQYGVLVVNAAGNWTYTLTDNTLNHGNPNATGAADQVGESFGVRMFDLDGDVSPTVQLNVLVNDDGPILTEGEGAQVSAIVDEDETSDGITDGDSVTNVASGGPGALGALVNFGADGVGSFGLLGSPAAIASLQAQGLSSGGIALTYNVAGNVLTASAGGETIFTLQVGGDGSFNFTLVGQLDHPTPDGNDDELLELPIDFSGVLTAVDGDGDSVGTFNGGSFVIDVEDDVPQWAGGRDESEEQFFPRVTDLVHEDALSTGDGAPHDGNQEGGQTTTASGAEGSLSALVDFGADGLGSFGLSSDVSSMDLQGLTSDGNPLTYVVVGNVLTASAGGETIFTLTVNADGSWEFVLQGPIDHPVADGDFDSEDLPGLGVDFSGILTATDDDGDPLVGGFPSGSFAIDIEDDVPVLAGGEEGSSVSGLVHEDALSVGGGAPHEGNSEGGQTTIVGSATTSSLSGLVSFGADGPGSFGLSSDVSSLELQSLTSGGDPLTYTVVGNVLTASAGGETIFTLTVGADGSWEFVLEGPLDHPVPDGSFDGEQLPGLGIDFSGVLTVTDGDGDPLAGGFPTGSFTVNVEDDVPRPDGGEKTVIHQQVQEDALTLLDGAPYEGNEEGGQTTIAAGDPGDLFALIDFGADGPGSVGLSSDTSSLDAQDLKSEGTELTYSVVGNVLTATANGNTIFTLTVEANGSYEFVLSGPLDHPIADSALDGETLAGLGIDFSQMITATDGDGDPMAVNLPNGSFAIDVEDDVPVAREIGQRPWVSNQVDEDELPGGITDGDTTGTVATGADGALFAAINFGADGPGTVGLTGSPAAIGALQAQGLTSGGVALSYTVVGNLLTATAGGNTIFTLQVDGDGSYTFTLSGPLDHPVADGTPAGDNELSASGIDFSSVITATDGDGDPLSGLNPGSFVIRVEDDIPVAVPPQYDSEQNPIPVVTANVDEDELAGGIGDGDGEGTSVSGPIGTLNALVNFGADGAGDFGLSDDPLDIATLEAQGLTSDSIALTYTVVGNVLTATAGGNPVFTLTVNPDGSYSFELQGPLDHPLPGSTDDDQLLGLPIDFSGVLTATDGDGDPVDGFADGSFVINVEDDIPRVDAVLSGQQPVALNTQDAETIGINFDSASSNFSGAFSATANHGADGPGTVTWSYSMVLLVAEGTLSGLSSDGAAIRLYQTPSGTIIGSTAGSEGAISGSNTIFTLSVNGSGVVTLNQYQEIDHELPGANGSYDAQEALLGSNLVGLQGTATITDYDQDTHSDSVTLDLGGKVAFDDHGPSISLGFGQHSEVLNTQDAQTIGGLSDTDTDSFSGAFTITSQNYGADGAGSVSASYALTMIAAEGTSSGLSSDGATVYLYESGGVIYGSTSASEAGVDPSNTIFTLSVNSATGQVTLTQFEEIDHSAPGVGSNYGNQEAVLGSGLVGLKGTVVITDGDGDTASADKTLDLGGKVAFDDDGPSITLGFGTAPVPTLNTQDAQTIGASSDTDSGNFGGALVVSSSSYGADGPGNIVQSYSLNLLSGGNGPLASGMNSAAGPIYLYKIGGEIVGSSSATLVGVAAGNTVFSLSVNSGTGQVTLTQFQEIFHDAPGSGSNYSNQEEVLLAGKIGLTLTATITDGDGDFATADKTLDLGGKIAFDDDGPSTSSNLDVQLDDDALAGGIAGGPAGTDDADALNVSGSLNHNFGADGAGTVKWLDSGAPGGFTYQASPDGSQLLVKQGGTTVLTLTLNTATGAYTVTQNAPIQHANADLENNQPFTLTYQVTDKDGDTATGSLTVNVDDDTPVAQDDHATVLSGQTQDVNLVFVLDFSGSISDSELNQMLDAVRTAGQELFNTATGAVQVQLVVFSESALSFGPFDSVAAFTAQVNALNPSEPGGVRPDSIGNGTDFTDAIEETMDTFTPLPGWNNQVVFISDGNPNQQTGTGGNSLADSTATAWDNFIDSNGINVTTIGIGNGITDERLEDVDLDAGPNNDPLRVDDFDDLVDTLVDQVTGGLVTGNVLQGSDNAVGGGDDDAYGADGPGRILSIEIDGVTYTWDGVLDGDEQLSNVLTLAGGKLSFNFQTGAWSYQAPASLDGDKTESFDYVIVDNDGDPSTATLTIHVEDTGPVEGFVDEDNLPDGIDDLDSVTDSVSGSVAELVVGPDAGSHFTLSSDTSGITPASSGGVALVYSVLGNTLTATAGPAGPVVFTLQVGDDGSYTFDLEQSLDHPADGSDDDQLLTLDFTSILQANDGSDPLTLVGNFLIHVEDDIPRVDAVLSGQQPVALNTQDAETIGINFDSSSSNFSGAFSATANHGADGPGTVTWSYSMVLLVAEGTPSGLSSDGAAIRLYQTPGGTIIGSTAGSEGAISGSNTIFTLSVNGSGVVTLNQYQEIDHELPGANGSYDAQEALLGSNLVGLQGTATITDYDQDTHSDSVTLDLGGKVAFDDHGPSISLGFGQHSEVLNTQDAQTIGGASDTDTDSFSGAFTITSQNFGADGAGSVSASYALTMIAAEGTSSGLSSDGATVYLYESGGVIYGSTSASEAGVDPSNTIFTLSVNSATGQVTLTQFEEIDHSAPGVGSNYSNQEAVLGSGLVGLKGTVVITDGDGDTASADKTLDLGGKVAFDDDGPSITLGFGTAPVPTLNTQDAQTIGASSDTDTGNFGGALVVSSSSYGADGPGNIVQSYSLNLLSGGNGPLASGMNSAAGPIYLYKIGGEIVGSSSATLVGVGAGNTVFSLSVNSGTGQVTLTQFQEIFHDAPGSGSNYSNQEEVLLAGKIGLTLTATITDGDGDFATADKTLDLGGKIAFDDDGPSTSSNLDVQLDDDALAGGIAGGPAGTDDADALNVSGSLNHNFGADGAGTVKWLDSGAPGGFTYQASPDGSQLLVKQGGTTVLTLTLNTATGAYTVTQNAPIQHANADLENNQPFTLTYQVTDKDGDTATGSLTVNVDDDTPVAQDDVAYVSTGQTEDINMVFVLDFSGSISTSELNLMLDAVRTAGQELFASAGGAVQVQLVVFSESALSFGPFDSAAAFSAQVNALNPSEPGGVRPNTIGNGTDFTDAIEETMDTFTPLPGWNNQVVFISDGNPNQQTGTGGNSLADSTATAWNNFVDSNGITVTTIGIGDGIVDQRLEDVDLDAGPNNDPLRVDDFDDLVDTLLDDVVGGLVNGNVLHGSDGVNNGGSGDDDGYGADGPGRILSIEINGITYVWDGAGVIDPSSGPNILGNQLTDIPTLGGGELDFNFATGAWTYRAPSTGSGDKVETFDYVIVDKDGDPSEATLTVYVEDISPVIAKVDEDELPGGITDNDAVTTVATGSVANLVVGPAVGVQFSLSTVTTGLDGASSGGTPLVYSVVGNTLLAKAGAAGPTVFTLQLESDGDYTFTLLKPLDHAPGGNDDDALLVLDFASILQASNGVDPVPLAGQFLVQIEDDVPIVSANDTVQLDDDALAGGIAGGPAGTDDVNALNVVGNLSHNFGADGAGTVKWLASGAPGGFTYQASPDGSQLLVKQGGTTVLTLTLNTATGAYTVTQNAPIQHANADLENNQSFTLSYQVTDKDGDTANGTLTVNVDDDTPVAQNDTAIVAESSGKDFNVAFVLDSSGSINGTEFATMMEAVRASGEALFNGTDGSVQITIVAFSTGATSYTAVSSLAAFESLVDNILANRPFNGNTNFTAAVEQTMDVYDPIPGWSNQVFFISDGNPNVDTGVNNSLQSGTATDWNNFIDSNGINVTTIGVGDGINSTRLQDVDLDGSGSPILVADFDDLIDTLLGQISGNVVGGNVLLGNDNVVGGGDDDAFGADGAGRVLSIEIDGVTYTWNGVGTIAVSTGGSIAGSQLSNIVTDLGGKLSFNFTNGTWSYVAPQSVASDTSESFDYVIIDKDGDPSQATLTVNIEDAAPVIGRVDEDELPGGITDNDLQTTVATGSLTELLIGNGPATFSLHSSPAFLPTLTSDGVAVTYNVVGNTLTAMAGAATIFTLVVQANGAYTFTLSGPLDHPLANGNDNEILTLNLTEAVKATNGGNPVPLAGDLLIQVEDDVPAILATSNLVYSNSGNPGGATGVFDYSTGADTRGSGPFSAADSDFKSITLTGNVGGTAISAQSVTWVSESATTATFDIEFDYAPNPANPGVKEEATGTLTFDKVNGTYTVTLDGPIEGFQVLKTSASLGITGYVPGGSTVDTTNPEVAVSQLATDFFVQFRSYAETGGGTGSNNLQTGGTNTNVFVNGETFTQTSSYVTLSNSANGVAGDTIGKGEVLDLNFYTSNPTGNLGLTPTGRADGVYLKFDNINNEDLVIVLKLVGAGGVTTTRALVVSNSDIYRNFSGATALAALAVYGITLDNNDGAIVIESNDYNAPGESWQIYGAQVLTSVEDITTTVALDYDRDFNDGFDGLTSFANQSDNDVVKVSDIGFIKTQTTTVDADLDFQVVVQDADNDATSSVNLHVTIEAGNVFNGTALADAIQGTTGNDTLNGLAGNDTLAGLAGADTLDGGAGNDLLIGGLGNDLLIGGADKDTYQWKAGDNGTDTIQGFVHNFNGNAQGDRLDLSQLLSGEHGQAGDIGNLLNFIDISTANVGGNGALVDTVIKVSDTSTADPATSTEQTIVLHDVNLLTLYGGGESGTILGMLGDGTLKVDVA